MSPRFQIILVIYIRTYPFIQSSLFFISTSYCYFVFLPGWHSGVIMVTEHNRLLMRRRLNADMVGVVFFFCNIRRHLIIRPSPLCKHDDSYQSIACMHVTCRVESSQVNEQGLLMRY